MHNASRVMQRHISRLEEQVSKVITDVGEVVDEDVHQSLTSIMSENLRVISPWFIWSHILGPTDKSHPGKVSIGDEVAPLDD